MLVSGGVGRRIDRSADPQARRDDAPRRRASLSGSRGFFLASFRAFALDTGDLGTVHLVNPDGAMHGLVVLFSNSQGWTAASDKIAAALARVAVWSLASTYLPTSPARRASSRRKVLRCGDRIELISRQIQRARGNANYRTPILAGVGEGGAFLRRPWRRPRRRPSRGPPPSIRRLRCARACRLARRHRKRRTPMAAFPMVLGSRFTGFGSSASTPPPTAPAAGVFRICRRRARRSDLQDRGGEQQAASNGSAVAPASRLGLGPAKPVISSLPLVELPASPHGHLLAIVFSATAAGAISTRRSLKSCDPLVFRSSVGTACAISGATNRPSRPRGI